MSTMYIGLRKVQEQELNFGTDRGLSQWGPILVGMMSNPRRRRRFRRTEFGVDNDDGNDINNVDNHRRLRHREHDGEIELDREVYSIIRRSRRSSASILQLLQGIREGINSDHESSVIGDYLAGPNLTSRQGTLPVRKEAVENLPTVKVCLDEFEKGGEAKEIPCKHKFHIRCIVPWLEFHGSCPMCRYELPPDDGVKIDLDQLQGLLSSMRTEVQDKRRRITNKIIAATFYIRQVEVHKITFEE
ncbi:unnamed protein product [Eruca vesicaria subsp. sativa]|uniref:RING-type E3 ubiquitin transferase n=1 Tax=Eruca vesicaria subsp. sativa TaxID=29727 RepID=A0ABC8JVF8_ERUVS|nr:unnamed protein product [Eruca vesicaria subsp. sativa]